MMYDVTPQNILLHFKTVYNKKKIQIIVMKMKYIILLQEIYFISWNKKMYISFVDLPLTKLMIYWFFCFTWWNE